MAVNVEGFHKKKGLYDFLNFGLGWVNILIL